MLKRIGMLEKMQRSHFVKKCSVQFVNANGKLSAPFYFWDNKPHECSQTWQVAQRVDQMLLDNAREHGVNAFEGVHVLEVLFGVRLGYGSRMPMARAARFRAKVVVDASGQAALLQNRFKLRIWDPVLNKGAIWTYWEGPTAIPAATRARRWSCRRRIGKGWFWYPQHDNVVSVGVVAPFDYLFKGARITNRPTTKSRATPAVKQRIGAKRVTATSSRGTIRIAPPEWPAMAG